MNSWKASWIPTFLKSNRPKLSLHYHLSANATKNSLHRVPELRQLILSHQDWKVVILKIMTWCLLRLDWKVVQLSGVTRPLPPNTAYVQNAIKYALRFRMTCTDQKLIDTRFSDPIDLPPWLESRYSKRCDLAHLWFTHLFTSVLKGRYTSRHGICITLVKKNVRLPAATRNHFFHTVDTSWPESSLDYHKCAKSNNASKTITNTCSLRTAPLRRRH